MCLVFSWIIWHKHHMCSPALHPRGRNHGRIALEAKETGLDPQEGLVPQEPEDDVVAKTATSLPDHIANDASQDVVVLRDRYLIFTNRPLRSLIQTLASIYCRGSPKIQIASIMH